MVRLAGHVGMLLVAAETGAPPGRWLAVGEMLALPVRLHQFCREDRAVHERMEAVMALSTEQEFALRIAQGTSLRG